MRADANTCRQTLTNANSNLAAPVRDTPIPFRDSIAEGGIAPICLVFARGTRLSIAEIPPFEGGGERTSTLHALRGGHAQKRGRGYRTLIGHVETPKTHSAQARGYR